MKKTIWSVLLLALLTLGACGDSESPAVEESPEASPTEEAAIVEFTSPSDGDRVTSPVKVEMKATGVEIEPAASGVRENAGHFHIIVDTDCVEAGQVIPSDDAHKHYGMAQTEAELTLTPGEHDLCLQVGDGAHVALPVTSEISVTVE